MLDSLTIRLIHRHQFETLCLYYGVKCQPGVCWGHSGQILIFTKNALTLQCFIVYSCNSNICISFRPSISFMGSKINLGSFTIIRVIFWFSLKVHYLFYITKYTHVIHTLASHSRDQQANWGQSGVDVSKPAGYAVCDGNMFSYPAGAAAGSCFLLVSSFFLSSFFWQHF